MQTRIYAILTKKAGDSQPRLVEATSAAQAIRYCAQNLYSAKPATPREVASYMQSGVVVESATENSQTTKQGEQ